MDIIKQLSNSIQSGFIDYLIPSNDDLRPQLVLNNPPESKVLHTLQKELEQCSSFDLSVAFITTGGIAMILQELYEAQARGIKGRILTSDYLGFTDPRALRLIREKLPNIELRIYRNKPFHAKGYLFYNNEESATLLIGSSNLTHEALATNREWNVRLVTMQSGQLLKRTIEEFNQAWEFANEVSEAFLIQYERIRANTKPFSTYKGLPFNEDDNLVVEKHIAANKMQKEALISLEQLRRQGESKALIISATGSGKTFLSAFDVKRFAPKKFLFIVHRQQIATAAQKSFKKIIGSSIYCSFVGGNYQVDKKASFIFAMIQTLSKEAVLHSFNRDEFDYIVVDEVHRAGATSYEKVLNYFKPKFLLGMTATPERSDGFDIYKLFDNNIAYEIRLNDALEADLLCPFHYYGIADLNVDGFPYEDLSQFRHLEKQKLALLIKDTIDKYTVPTLRRRGLIFVSRNEEATILSTSLNNLGYKTLALSSSDSESVRNSAFDRLEASIKEEGALEYLIAVDILNEGIDIPSLNQIIMLRPTQSAIVFVQQMGRGLRKFKNKEFVTIIDFIGNYKNNYLIPVALYGDTSFKKDQLRRLVSSGSLQLHGVSTVSFDKVAKERIYKAINEISFKNRIFLKEEFLRVKMRVGSIPTMIDFVNHGAISPLLFIDYSKNYLQFKMTIGAEKNELISILHHKSLNFFSKIVAPGLRPYEGVIIELLMSHKTNLTFNQIKIAIEEKYQFKPSIESLKNSVSILQNKFFTDATRNTFGNLSYCEFLNGTLVISKEFEKLLENKTYKNELIDILNLGELEYRKNILPKRDKKDLILYHKYSRQDVCRLLNWEKDLSATLYGYRVDKKSMNCPIFVTYHKRSEIDPTVNYHDRFISPHLFEWETRTRVRLNSKEPKAIRNEEGQLDKYLFIQKNNDEGISFYYMGKIEFISNQEDVKRDSKGNLLPIVVMQFEMEHSVSPEIYEYITQK